MGQRLNSIEKEYNTKKKKKGVLFIFMQVIKWVKKYSFFFPLICSFTQKF